MAATFASILPRLKTVLETITLDGSSNRTIRIPLDYPETLNGSSLPMFINRITRIQRQPIQTRTIRDYVVTITMTLFLSEVGTQLSIINQYDIYGYLDKLEDLFINKSRLEDSNTIGLQGISSAVQFVGTPQIPVVRGYPFNLATAPQYNAAEFTINIPFTKTKDC